MSDVLLQALTNTDIDWMVTTGERHTLEDEAVLIASGDELKTLYLLLEGQLSMQAPCSSREFAVLSRGDIIGAGWLFDLQPVASVVAKGAAVVLSIDKDALQQKLKSDVSFAAHFHRAIALIMSERIRQQFEIAQVAEAKQADLGKTNGRNDRENADLLRFQSGQMVKEALFVFSELHDSDIDWMMHTGSISHLSAEDVLLNMGRPVDALYTVLDGQLAIATTEFPYDPFSGCSQKLAALAQSFTPLAFISRGGLPGIISFLDFKPLPVRIHATRSAKVLKIPRQAVVIKLQEDPSFAARFYRVIATQTAHLLSAVTAIECKTSAAEDTSGISDIGEGELDIESLQKASEGGQKFDWMLKRLQVEA